MLRELAVHHLALIEDVRVELQPGFCAWSGETGAGKTLLLEALGLLLGERGSTELIRRGADELRITGRFELTDETFRRQVEQALNHPIEDEQLILTRRLTKAGRSYAYVNDQPVAVGTLRQVGEVLVDVHGQRESHSLLQPSYQLELLDAFAGLESQRAAYQTLADELRELRRTHQALVAAQHQRQRELALLEFEKDELDRAAPRSGELAALLAERERLAHAQALQAFATAASDHLYDQEGSIVEQLGKLRHEAEGWASMDTALADVARRLQGLVAETQDLAETLRGLVPRWEADPARLEEVEERVALLRRLEAKYGRGIDELIAYWTSLEEQQARLKQQEHDQGSLEGAMADVFGRIIAAADDLSKQRRRAAKKLTDAVQKQLADLGMAEAHIEAALEPVSLGDNPTAAELPAAGADRLELMLAANRGEPARPLRKVASGGELSRTMLALKTVLAKHDRGGTLVFDEIDANVGGRLGDVLGAKLAALGQTHQVICVTHLPQVASYARHQWTIRKARRGSRTVTTITLLDENERLEELAHMLRGDAKGETTRKEAAAMLAAAKASW